MHDGLPDVAPGAAGITATGGDAAGIPATTITATGDPGITRSLATPNRLTTTNTKENVTRHTTDKTVNTDPSSKALCQQAG